VSVSGTTAEDGRLDLASVVNLRDVGGCAARDGSRVRRGLLYRSGGLNRLTTDDATVLTGLGVRAIYDLRTARERETEPDHVVPGAQPIVADVLGGSSAADATQVMRAVMDPGVAGELLGGDRGVALWLAQYRHLVTLPSARLAYHTLFSGLAAPAHRPALVHCSTGKDRTGWAVAALLLFLGVDYETVVEDYLRSTVHLESFLHQVGAEFAARGGDPAILRPVMTVRRDYLDAAHAEMRRHFGTVERYCAIGLRLDAGTRSALRSAFLAPAS
jgi:protein-tyrosine phosphatase